MYRSLIIFIAYLIVWYPSNGQNGAANQVDDRPNIIVIIGDDIGYADIGCYGAEIETHNLDRLAENGMRFRNFYNMAKCNPTRSTMITGLFQGDERSISFVPLLKEVGYSAMMSGKEHFDPWVPQRCYFAETFENAFTFWATTEYFVPPSGKFERPFYLNGVELDADDIKANIEPKYKTDFITDYALDYLDLMIERDQPYFLLLPYHAAHYPLQARPEDVAKYRGKYARGWDQVRNERFEQMKDMGILHQYTKISPPSDNTNQFRGAPDGWPEIRERFSKYFPWDSLSKKEQDEKDLEMAVFAAMIDRMDQNIGRVLDRVEAAGDMENTLIVFFSDNGSCPFDSNKDFDVPPGPTESYRCLSTPWANVGNTPYRLYKQNGHEGGANTHFIAHWPNVIEPNQITDSIGHVADLFPTFLDIADINYPAERYGQETLPLDGRSLFPIFTGDKPADRGSLISGHKERFRMFRNGKWKIVRENGADWELYDMIEDPTELNDLSKDNPDVLDEMVASYNNQFSY
ncbi:MAG: sulfatase-like hydrolase/transferase [Saprospiraceae bacterium]|nr:sulfatase-like hydrolase/transferase [Saprospiraceae bacterium]